MFYYEGKKLEIIMFMNLIKKQLNIHMIEEFSDERFVKDEIPLSHIKKIIIPRHYFR